MMRAPKNPVRSEAGVALLTTVLLLLLMSSLLVGFVLVVNSGQQLNGANNEYSKAFYAAEAGMEKMTADLGTLFTQTYSPSGTQVSGVTTTPPSISGVTYTGVAAASGADPTAATCTTGSTLTSSGNIGYQIQYPIDANGNPSACSITIKSGSYQGMNALATPYTMTVTARTSTGSEVRLQRTSQTVGIPAFQFGIFSDVDLGFHAGPDFKFGGRVHTNGNLFLSEGNGATLTMSDRVTAFKDIIRTNNMNGVLNTTGGWAGTVTITTSPGTSSYRNMASNEGSLTGTVGSSVNPNWSSISLGTTNYAGNVRNGATGVTQLNLGIVTIGSGSTQAIDIIRRPYSGESTAVTAERYYSQASFRVLLSDNPTDITSLSCTSSSAPFDLSQLAAPVSQWPTGSSTAVNQLYTKMNSNNTAGYSTPPIPLAASGAVQGQTVYTINDHNGYWLPNPSSGTTNPSTGGTFSADSGYPIIRGYIKIEIQTAYGNPCGTWQDVTTEVLAYGYAGRDLNPWSGLSSAVNDAYPASTTAKSQVTPGYSSTGSNPPLLALPTAQLAASACPDPHPNAIIRLERIRDNPSNWATSTGTNPYLSCGITLSGGTTGTVTGYPTHPTDYWPNAIFDTREGTLRDVSPAGSLTGASYTSAAPSVVGTWTYNAVNYNQMVALNGVMNYIEVDANNLAKYLAGTLPGSGHLAYDSTVAPNDYSVYISDRRGNYTATPTTGSWPPKSPTQTETGEYGFSQFINSTNATSACPDGTLDTGEDLNASGVLYTYGQDPTHTMAAGVAASSLVYGQYGTYSVASLNGANTTLALTPYSGCSVSSPSVIWPMSYAIHANEARENANPFFRRAIKVVNGKTLNLGTCPGNVACGLTIATENPAYVQGDFNTPVVNSTSAPWTGVRTTDLDISTSIIADSVTFLSNAWNDVNSFSSPYSQGLRVANTTYYRLADLSGKGIGFPWINGTNVDTGSDGGVHNFIRYIENWGGQTLWYRGSIVSLYYNRQATGIFKCCTTVYSPPTRGYNFDVEFLTPTLLPPRTPMFRDVNTTGFTQLLLPTQ